MKNKTKNKSLNSSYLIIGIVIFLAIIIWLIIRKENNSVSSSEIDNFARCLTEKGAIMYGTFWCPHCAKTKKKFGEAFNFIHYIECDPRGDNEQAELCLSKEIDKYYTWEFSDGTRIISEPTFEQLSQKTGCLVSQ